MFRIRVWRSCAFNRIGDTVVKLVDSILVTPGMKHLSNVPPRFRETDLHWEVECQMFGAHVCSLLITAEVLRFPSNFLKVSNIEQTESLVGW